MPPASMGIDGTYTGKWVRGIPHGYGTWTGVDGSQYVGWHRDGLAHGKGTWTHVDGHQYVGNFKENEMDGKGTMTINTKGKFGRCTFVGEFKDSLYNGYLRTQCENGYVIAKTWPKGKRGGHYGEGPSPMWLNGIKY